MKYWYLASAYSKYPHGLEAAFQLVATEAARLIKAGVPVFSPIAMTHPIAMAGHMDPLDHSIWLPADEPFMKLAHGIIMLRMESWELSYGMKVELEAFQSAGKPIVWMDVGVLPAEFA